MAGILFWNFFQQSIVSSMNSVKSSAYILQKLPVPMAVFPVSAVISGVINLGFAFVPMMGLVLLTDHPLSSALLFLPVSVLIATLFTLGMGLLLAPLAVFFSDIVELVGVVLTLLFYMTPIIYPMTILKGQKFAFMVQYNPTRSILEVFRDPIYLGKIPPISHLSVSIGLAILVFLIGAWAFRRSSSQIPFYL